MTNQSDYAYTRNPRTDPIPTADEQAAKRIAAMKLTLVKK